MEDRHVPPRARCDRGGCYMLTRRWYLGWGVMTFLALAVVAYAVALLVKPSLGPAELTEPMHRLHLFGGALALALGPWQFLTGPRARRTAWHRWTGRLYGFAVLASALGGAILAVHSKGGMVAHVGFFTLAVVWTLVTAWGVVTIRRGDVAEHQRWILRSFALTYAAVTLRLQIPASVMLGFDFAIAYPIIAWACWVPNAMWAEWYLKRDAVQGAARRA
jgi:hypothetical protein